MMLSNGKVAKMPDKLTDNEIVKALECCKGEDIPCADCPYIDFGQCQTYVAKDALDLINRQKAELSDANKSFDHIKQLWEEEKTKVAMAKQKLIKACRDLKTAKAEIENYKQIAEHQQSVTLDRGFEIKRLKEEIERLNKEIDRLSQVVLYNDGITEMKVEEAKAEAYKEFAEMLIFAFNHITYSQPCENIIDNLLKKLVGEDNAKN